MEKSNLKEFKELILKYESITIEKIENSDSYQNSMDPKNGIEEWFSEEVMQELTGFGTLATCTLCAAIDLKTYKIPAFKLDCSNCTWVKEIGYKCYIGMNQKTYDNFEGGNIDSEEGLIKACKARAKYMREVINWYEDTIN